jgi:uncharacterized protein (DUF952 family)
MGMENENVILHIISEGEWDKVKNENYYFPDSLKKEGFIHCATSDQILSLVEFIYKEKVNRKVLYIDSDKLTAKVVYEDLHKTGKTFPHIYGALNLNAVVKVVDFKPTENGIFELPSV